MILPTRTSPERNNDLDARSVVRVALHLEEAAEERDAAVAVLRHAGWRVALAGRSESVSVVWERLARYAGAQPDVIALGGVA